VARTTLSALRRSIAAVTLVVATAIAATAAAEGAERPPARLAVLSPSAAETLVILGVGDEIVAVGDWVRWPPELALRPRLGAFDAPSEEALLALGVDTLITTASEAGREGRQRLARLGVRVVEIDTSTLAGALDAIATLGQLVDRRDAAQGLAKRLRDGLDAIRARAAGAPRPRVLVVVGREPLYVAGPGSHLGELVTIAGGVNVAADVGSTYALVSLEAMLTRAPEVILDVADEGAGGPFGARAGDWARWSFLPAVADGRVWFLDPSRLTVPGPRLVEMAALFARVLHPELFGAPTAEDFTPLVPGALP
jgi:iron complex transport system substrate-binding protein